MEFTGIYKFYQDGELIGESKNQLTETGRILALKTLMGAVPSFAGSLSIGIDNTANSPSTGLAANKDLGFKVASSPVISSNAMLDTNDVLVFKARVDDPSAYSIYEVGLFSNPLSGGSTTNRQEVLINFEGSDNITDSDGSALTDNGRFIDRSDVTYGSKIRNGNTALLVDSGESVVSLNSFSGIETFGEQDNLVVAYYADLNADLNVTFYSGEVTKSYDFAYTGAAAYRVVSTPKGTTPENFSWSNITKITFSAANGNIMLDGIKFTSADFVETNNGMVSRTSLGASPIEKYAGIPIDIEYYLRVDF